MLKKVMCAVLVGIMLFTTTLPFAGASADAAPNLNSSAITASSAMTESGDIELEYATATEVPVLDITFEGTGAVILNPYKVDVTIADHVTESGIQNVSASATAPQVISSSLTIKSRTKVPVLVGAKLKNTPDASSGVVFASKSLKDDTKTTTKSVFIFLHAASAAPSSAPDYASTNKNQMLLGTKEISQPELFTIKKSNGTAYENCVLKFYGDMCQQPTTPWKAQDTIKPTLTLSLKVRVSDAAST